MFAPVESAGHGSAAHVPTKFDREPVMTPEKPASHAQAISFKSADENEGQPIPTLQSPK